MVSASDSFIHGKPSQNLMSPSATPAFLPLVCYEVIFSGGLGKAVQNAQWMLNLTNDAWFEGTIGAEQHFAHARLRAIEEGVPLVRVANKGVTAIVDPLGRITVQLSKSEASAINAKLPERLERTVFSDYRHGLFYLMIFGAFLIVLLRNRWRRYWEVTS
jgi:apolipoprotein N-acyltransferase